MGSLFTQNSSTYWKENAIANRDDVSQDHVLTMFRANPTCVLTQIVSEEVI